MFTAALEAFAYPNPRGGPPPPPEPRFDGDFEALEAALGRTAVSTEALAADLAHEVDAGQATIFARRLAAVEGLLEQEPTPTARLLRVGLRQRLEGILAAARPRALRVRALADFYYSFAGLHHHRRKATGKLRTRTRLIAAAQWRPIVPGLEHSRVEGMTGRGPLRLNVLRVEPGAVEPLVLDCRASVARGESFPDLVAEHGAVAAVSGGFFLYSEPDIAPPSRRFDPVGLLVSDGRVLGPPIFARGGLAFDRDGRWSIGRVGPQQITAATVGGVTLDLGGLVTRAQDERGGDVASLAVASGRVVAVGRKLQVPLNGFVVDAPPEHDIPVGSEVVYTRPRVSGKEVWNGIAGGPLLLAQGEPSIDLRAEDFWGTAPPVTFSQDETGDLNLLPRLAAGIDGEGRLVLVAVDGRNLELALGLTLREVAESMAQLGCHTATNLDGGSSKRMVIQGEIQDAPSTGVEVEAKGSGGDVRPVHTALLLR